MDIQIKTIFFLFLFFFTNSLFAQEVGLTSLDQLSDPNNSGKTFILNKSFNLAGETINITSGITLKPAGGQFFNGTLFGDDFTISTEKTNRIFADDLVLGRLYTKTFFPEWYGARGDGVTDDSAAFEKAITYAKFIDLNRHRSYMFHSPVHVNKTGNVVINGNGATLITNGFKNIHPSNNDYLLNFGNQFNRVFIEDLKIDGRNALASGITVSSSFIGDGLDLRNFFNEDGEAVGIHFEVIKKSDMRVQNSTITNLKSPKNGKIGDAIGASRAIRVYWRHTDDESQVRIHDNTLTHTYGDDGDVIQIADNRNDYINPTKTVIERNLIGYASRRLIKATAGNIKLFNNTFKAMELDNPEALPDNQKTYMVAFQPFSSGLGREAKIIPGIEVAGNTFDNTLGYEGTLGLIQTDGAVIERNTFINGKLVFARFNQDFLVQKNNFIDSRIATEWHGDIDGNNRIINNTGTFNAQNSVRHAFGFFTMEPYTTVFNLEFRDNYIKVIEDRERAFLGFIYCHPNNGLNATSMKVYDNTFERDKGNNNDSRTARSEFVYSRDHTWDSNTEFIGNTLITDSTQNRGIYFRGPFSVPTTLLVRDNKFSSGDEMLLTTGLAF